MDAVAAAVKRKASNDNAGSDRNVRPKQAGDDITLNVSEEQAFQLLGALNVESDLFKSTARNLIRTTSPEKRFEEGLIEELLNRLRANGADEARVVAARPVLLDALKAHLNDRFLGKIGSRLLSVKHVRNTVIAIVDAFADAHNAFAEYPELRKQLINIFTPHIYTRNGTAGDNALNSSVSHDSGYGSMGNTPVIKDAPVSFTIPSVPQVKSPPAISKPAEPVVTPDVRPVQSSPKPTIAAKNLELERLRERERELLSQLGSPSRTIADTPRQTQTPQRAELELKPATPVVTTPPVAHEQRPPSGQKELIEKQRELLKLKALESQRLKDAATPPAKSQPAVASVTASTVTPATTTSQAEKIVKSSTAAAKPASATTEVDELIKEVAAKGAALVEAKNRATAKDSGLRTPSAADNTSRARSASGTGDYNRKLTNLPTSAWPNPRELTCWYWHFRRPPCEHEKSPRNCRHAHELKDFIAARDGRDPPILPDSPAGKDMTGSAPPSGTMPPPDSSSALRVKGIATSAKTPESSTGKGSRPVSRHEQVASKASITPGTSGKPSASRVSKTPIVDALWNTFVPTTPEMGDKIVQMIMTNILKRGRSQEFITTVRDERNKVVDLSLQENAGLRSKLFGLFNTFHHDKDKIRHAIEIKLRPLVLHNPSKFKDLPSYVFDASEDVNLSPSETPAARAANRAKTESTSTGWGSKYRPGDPSKTGVAEARMKASHRADARGAGSQTHSTLQARWDNTPKTNQFEVMTCPFWYEGFCHKSQQDCAYRHELMEYLAGPPGVRPRPLDSRGDLLPLPPRRT